MAAKQAKWSAINAEVTLADRNALLYWCIDAWYGNASLRKKAVSHLYALIDRQHHVRFGPSSHNAHSAFPYLHPDHAHTRTMSRLLPQAAAKDRGARKFLLNRNAVGAYPVWSALYNFYVKSSDNPANQQACDGSV